MSELITPRPGLTDFRWRLLATASALTLLTLTASEVKAEDSDRPTVWIDLGGQLSRLQDSQEAFAPQFLALTPSIFSSPQKVEKPPLYSVDETAKVSFQPKNSNWIFSASIRYGRASTNENKRQQSYPGPFTPYRKFYGSYGFHRTVPENPVYPIAGRFTDVRAQQSKAHTILDFNAGKDVGLGVFSANGSSSINFGVRFAQFQSKSRVTLRENPDWHFATTVHSFSTSYYGHRFVYQSPHQPFHSYVGSLVAERSFHGIGPSVSWDSSIPIAGNLQSGEMTLDIGANFAVLFGRQKAKVHHQTTGRYHPIGSYYNFVTNAHLETVYQRPATPDHTRSRSVVVPNVGAFAGLSFKYSAAQVSFGYKADFFFGAMDGGIDIRRSEDVGFHGPYASVSIGLGG